MEREKLVGEAGKAGVIVHWTAEDALGADLRTFLAGRTVARGNNLEVFAGMQAASADAEVGVVWAKVWVVETATALVDGGDTASLLPPVSVLLVRVGDIVERYDSLVDALKAEPDRRFAAVTGPSRTADIEKVLVIPAHGPKELHVFIVE